MNYKDLPVVDIRKRVWLNPETMEIENYKGEDYMCDKCGILDRDEVKHTHSEELGEEWDHCKKCGNEVSDFDPNEPF